MTLTADLARPMATVVRQATRFFLGCCFGLTVDLAVFEVSVRIGSSSWLANTLSSGCAVLVVYFFVTKYAFQAARSRSSFALFVGWYVVSILGFSLAIEGLHITTGLAPFPCKLASLPFSFVANFLFSRWLFHGRQAAATAGGHAPGAARGEAHG